MTQTPDHTHGFYLVQQNRIKSDINANRATQRIITGKQKMHSALLQMQCKYLFNEKTLNKINRNIAHNQILSQRLDSDYSSLQSAYKDLKEYVKNNDDDADRAYDAAYATRCLPTTQLKRKTLFTRIAELVRPRTK